MNSDTSWFEDGQDHLKSQPSTSGTQRGRPPDEEPKETKPDVRNIIESVCLIDDEDDAEEAVNAFHHMTRKKLLLPFTGVEIQEEFKFLEAIKQFKMVLEEKVEVLTSRQNLKEFLYKYLVFFASNYSRIAVLYQEQYLDVMEDILLFYCDVIKEFFRDQKRRDKKMNVVQEARRIKILFRDCLLTRMDRILHVLLKVRLAPEIEECRMFWGDVYMYFLTKVRYLYSDDDILRGFVAFQKFKTIRAKSEAAMIDQLMYSVYTKTTAELRRIPCLGEMMDRMKGDRLYTVWDMVTRYMRYYQEKRGRAERCFEMEDFDEDTEDSRANDMRRLDLSGRSPVRTMPARRRGLRKTVLDLADDPQNQLDECNVEFSLFGEDIGKQEAPDDAVVVLDDDDDDDVIVVCDDLKTVITIDDDDDEVEEERPAQIQPPKSPPPREVPSPEKVLRAVAQVAAPPPGEPSPEKFNISPSKTQRQVKRVDNSLRITINSFVPSERSVEDASTVVHNVNNVSDNVDLQQVAPPCIPSSRLTLDVNKDSDGAEIQRLAPLNFLSRDKIEIPATLDVNKESERVEDRQQIQSTVIAKEKEDGAASEAPTTHLNQSQYNQPMETEEVPNIMPIDQSASQKELSSGSDEGIMHMDSPDVSNSCTLSANLMNPAEGIGMLPSIPSNIIPSDLEDSPEKPMSPPSTAKGVLPSSKVSSDLENSSEKPMTPPSTAKQLGVLPSSKIPSDLKDSPEKPITPPSTAKGVLPSSKVSSDLENSSEKPMTPPSTAKQLGVLPSSKIPSDLEDSPEKPITPPSTVKGVLPSSKLSSDLENSSETPMSPPSTAKRLGVLPSSKIPSDLEPLTARRVGVLPSSRIPSDLESSPEKPMTPPLTAKRIGVLPSSKIPSDLESSPEKPVTPPLTARQIGVLSSSRISNNLEDSPEKPMTPPSTAKRVGVLPSSRMPSDLESSPEKSMTPPLTAKRIGVLPSSKIPSDLEDSPEKMAPSSFHLESEASNISSPSFESIDRTEVREYFESRTCEAAVVHASGGSSPEDGAPVRKSRNYSNLTECFTKFTEELCVEDILTSQPEDLGTADLIDLVPTTDTAGDVIVVKCRPIEPLKDEENTVSGAETLAFSADEVLAPSSETIALLVTYPLVCESLGSDISDSQHQDGLTLSGSQPYTPQSSPSTRIEAVKSDVSIETLDSCFNHSEIIDASNNQSEKPSALRAPSPGSCVVAPKNTPEGFREDLSHSVTSATPVTPQEVDKIAQLPFRYSQPGWGQPQTSSQQNGATEPNAGISRRTAEPDNVTCSASFAEEKLHALYVKEYGHNLSQPASRLSPPQEAPSQKTISQQKLPKSSGISQQQSDNAGHGLNLSQSASLLSSQPVRRLSQPKRRESQEAPPVKIYTRDKPTKSMSQSKDRVDMSLKSYKALIKDASKKRSQKEEEISQLHGKCARTSADISRQANVYDHSELFNNGMEGPIGKPVAGLDVDDNFFWNNDDNSDITKEDAYNGTIFVKPDWQLYRKRVPANPPKNVKSASAKVDSVAGSVEKSAEKKKAVNTKAALYVKIAPIDIDAHQRDLARKIQQANELKLRQQRQIKLALEMREKQLQSLRRDQILIQIYSDKSADSDWFSRARASVTTAKSKDQSNHSNNGHKATEKRKYRDFSPDTDEAIPRKKTALATNLLEKKHKNSTAPKRKTLKVSQHPPVSSKSVATDEVDTDEGPSSPIKMTKSGRVCKKPRTDYSDVIKSHVHRPAKNKVKKRVRFEL